MSEAARTALILVDVQNDFCPGGALGVPEGDRIVPACNRLLAWARRTGAAIVATRDWHPRDHCSFAERGGGWPPHCVAGTPGAAFHPDLELGEDAWIVSKAVTPDVEAYSGFAGTGLADGLRRRGVDLVVVCGLATDYCVKATALDARREGFGVTVVEDAIRAVEVRPGDGRRAVAEMRDAGVEFRASSGLV